MTIFLMLYYRKLQYLSITINYNYDYDYERTFKSEIKQKQRNLNKITTLNERQDVWTHLFNVITLRMVQFDKIKQYSVII